MMTTSMYILLFLAVVFANVPFFTPRLLGVLPVKQKHFGHHLCELALGFVLAAVLAYVLESQTSNVHQQDWEFYVVVLCLYLVAAFPGFVWRYFWQGKHKE